jgi:hypothetical protein
MALSIMTLSTPLKLMPQIIATISIKALGITTPDKTALSITIKRMTINMTFYAECHYAECYHLLNVVASF